MQDTFFYNLGQEYMDFVKDEIQEAVSNAVLNMPEDEEHIESNFDMLAHITLEYWYWHPKYDTFEFYMKKLEELDLGRSQLEEYETRFQNSDPQVGFFFEAIKERVVKEYYSIKEMLLIGNDNMVMILN